MVASTSLLLLPRILTDETLLQGWFKVYANEGGAGLDGITIERFAQNVFDNLGQLRKQVQEGRYQPQPLLQVKMKRDGGRKPRMLAIPAVRDRVLQSAACLVITPLLDRHFEDESWGYRRGRSIKQAVAQIARFRDEGFQWVVDADIASYFEEINQSLLLEKISQLIPEEGILWLIRRWVKARIKSVEGPFLNLEKGISQGSPLSPVLSNLYLDELDEALQKPHFHLVRYADDFLILCKDLDHAAAALALTGEVLNTLQLSLHTDKTRIVHFDEGFQFLGIHFQGSAITPVRPEAALWLIPEASSPANEPQKIAPTNHFNEIEKNAKYLDISNTMNLSIPPLQPHSQHLQDEEALTTTDTPEELDEEIITPDAADFNPLLRTLYV